MNHECRECEGQSPTEQFSSGAGDPGSADWLARFPHRARQWKLTSRKLVFGKRPLVMGIVNCTPDSFSDGGRFLAADKAVEQALKLAAEGADILDIGGESTRPYSEPVDADEESRRVLPVIKALKGRTLLPISIDTSKAAVAQAAIAAGAEIINDVTGLAGDPAMAKLAASTKAGVCIMHMQGTPQNMQDHPTYDDVVGEVLEWLTHRCEKIISDGVSRESIAIDPGIGFGKSHQHNLNLLANCHRFHALGYPLLLGPSRKGFIAKVLDDKETDRTAGTIGACLSLAGQGIQILRVHDVVAIRQALELFAATGGIDGFSRQLRD